MLAALFPLVDAHLRAAGLLVRFEGGEADGLLGWLASYRVAEIVTREESYAGDRVRLYLPDGADENRPAVTLVHGVHPRGIEERRLVRFAETIARAGVIVATPELPGLAAYDLSPGAVERIGASARYLAERTDRPTVGVIGISFSGGLALLAATDPDVPIEFVVSLGGHHDLARVVRWYLGDTATGPDGDALDVRPHPYGIGVFLYAHATALFEEGDVAGARDVLAELLAGRRDAARRLRSEVALSESGLSRIDMIFDYLAGSAEPAQVEELANRVRDLVRAESDGLSRVSPSNHLTGLTRDVFVIHGLTDPIVPSTESRWLSRDIPAARLRNVLITDVMRHAEYDRKPSVSERWAMVSTMADILRAAQ